MLDKLPTHWIHRIAQTARTPTAIQFMLAARAPRRHQTKQLRELVSRNAQTEFGRAHGFSEIKDFDAYRAKVPLMSSKALRPWVERMQRGESRLLTVEDPVFYGRSTGTSGTPKEIPINDTYRADFQRSVMTAMWFCYWRVPEAFSKKLLYFVADRCVDKTALGIEIGNISGYNFTKMPEQVRSIYAWPYELVEVQDLPTRTYLALHIAVLEEVSLIAGIFPTGVLLVLRALETQAADLALHIGQGTYPDWLELTDEQRSFFSKYLRKDPEVAARMQRVADAPIDQKVSIALPDLRAIFCWKSSTAGLYIPELQERVGPNVEIFDTVYSATEGWCSVPVGEDEDGGPVALTSHIYEFIEEDVVDAVDADVEKLQGVETRLVDELIDGERYYIVVTTSAGLYRYFLGDLLEVCGHWRGLPRIKFVRKYGASYNLVGEKLEESHVNDAMKEALAEVSARAVWFAMLPVFGDEPRYDVFIEFGDEQEDPERLARFARALHVHLERVNFSWEEFTVVGTLEPMKVSQVKHGTYDDYLARWEASGRSLGQLKISHLLTDPDKLPCVPERDVVLDVVVDVDGIERSGSR